ncbi:MAG: transglycosylase SLT domain-containing protein [Bacteroidota bacterium]|nr:transglycosylase SLT domain-containing protein [Bacteroidota bacterium]MDP4231879.1 transglycosylase SLT domain-containing protein [Bacteroidota bacterium]MDP4242765.1 transglycosylase SLT domain-containing protein [Bacteroidota bacterium]MDP4287216.1 transglycosylase SLT domain-containing protein [Bacteroidota bacterium]
MIFLIILHLSTPALIARTIDAIALRDSTSAVEPLLIPYRNEILRAAARYHLQPALIAAVIQEESRFEQWATRHEPRYATSRRVHHAAISWVRTHRVGPNSATEFADRSRSYGLMQVMGETAREQGFDAPYLAELYLPANAIEHGARLLAHLLGRYPRDTLAAISAYNQGSARRAREGPRRGAFLNARYVYRVCLAWQAYTKSFAEETP